MKRITYISRNTRELDASEIASLGESAASRNAEEGITGVLVHTSGLFFQTIEGEDGKIDALFERIRRDPRHEDVTCLEAETDPGERHYPDWSMKTVNLDEQTGELMRPLGALLRVLSESHHILERYTQPTIFRLISEGLNPLLVPPRRVERVVLFSDIMGFSRISLALPIADLTDLVNVYVDTCSSIISRGGGEVNKLIGDCVMATFDGNAADAALESALGIVADLGTLRGEADGTNPLCLLNCGVGLAAGEVFLGNIGNRIKTDYTVLGAPVNQASYLEGLTRRIPCRILFSDSLKERLSTRWQVVEMGTHSVIAGQPPCPVYTVDSRWTSESVDATAIYASIEEHLALLPDAGGTGDD